LNALSYILPGPGQPCYTLPATGRDVPPRGITLVKYGLLHTVSWEKIKWKEIEEIETRKEV